MSAFLFVITQLQMKVASPVNNATSYPGRVPKHIYSIHDWLEKWTSLSISDALPLTQKSEVFLFLSQSRFRIICPGISLGKQLTSHEESSTFLGSSWSWLLHSILKWRQLFLKQSRFLSAKVAERYRFVKWLAQNWKTQNLCDIGGSSQKICSIIFLPSSDAERYL